MNFNLDRDLVFLDIESTGLHVIHDRIIQLALIKYQKGKEEPEEYTVLVNPGREISEESISIHGITPEMVADKPFFKEVAREVHSFIGSADLAGYNSNRFDVPMLMEELDRAGIPLDMSERRTIDVMRIFTKMEPRNLAAALKFYTGQELENAHDALEDVRATVKVLHGQLDRYADTPYDDGDGNISKPVQNDMQALHDFTTDLRFADVTQKLKYDLDGQVVFNFGKYNGQPVGKFLYKDRQYLGWMLNKDFSYQVKDIIQKEVKAYADNLAKGQNA
ncbi:3'-5' exonuclease [Membranicola marinus]|uniref:3'-5' exonuclease n=1 Tax=Membranihabitans marinus TaxID=1227546 RepID=A0A953L5J4_9BACT|nr:3'-5' exonuclease [Membranihabitans marinus]MBY5956652.1 3'-5' exonuclease [Membranihabitans marinus]